MSISSYNPRTGLVNGVVQETTSAELNRVLEDARHAKEHVADAEPDQRRGWLYAVAGALERRQAELVALAESETALGPPRLAGEVVRMTSQLRFYGDVAVEGSYLRATIDSPTASTPGLARLHRPLGPVAVFGASNFPFAFSVLGNDTGSALAAGCPVVVKAHPAHPLLSVMLTSIAQEALAAAGARQGTLAAVAGLEAGIALVRAPTVQAVAFTGSQAGGLALWRAANERETVIPVLAEMGTVNPVVLTPAALGRLDEVAAGFVESFTLGRGQFCTKPGLLLSPRGSGAASAIAAALRAHAPKTVMLTEAIARAVGSGVAELESAGATVVETVAGLATGWGAPSVVLEAPVEALRKGSRLLEECFGPVVVVVEYDDARQLEAVFDQLQGALAASVFTAASPDATSDDDAAAAVRLLSTKVGRVCINEWPTGVAFTWAQHHGGPWPSTSTPATTSVGSAALDRFVRPVTYQSAPDAWLPAPLRSGNPWRIPRRIDGVLHDAATR